MMIEFIDYFQSFYEHMVMIKTSPSTYSLIPPNQCDWFITIEEKENDMWFVHGIKDDVYSMHGPEEFSSTYVYKGGVWALTVDNHLEPERHPRPLE
jgi:hypothetical protein